MNDDPMRAMIRAEILKAMQDVRPAQYTRDDLARMSPEQISQARRSGHFVLLLPMRRNLPAVDHDGIATVPADESVTDVQPGTSGPHEFPSTGGEYQAPAGTQKP